MYRDLPEGDRDWRIATNFDNNGEFDVVALGVGLFDEGLLKYLDTFPEFVSVFGDATPLESPVDGLKKDNKLGCFDM